MRNAISFVAIIFALWSSVVAEEPKPIELTIEPRAIETPVLKYRLFPSEAEMKPGNAATILLRLPWGQTPYMENIFPNFSDWESRPLDAPEWDKSEGVLYDNFYRELKRAAYRRDALWEYPIGEEPNPYLILLPDVGDLRNWLGQGLSARIRYHLSRNELDEAREAILVGLANGRHIAQTPFYVNQMVAHIIHQKMFERVDEMILQPNSPNLYWALTSLPESLLQMDRAGSLQSEMFAMTFPAIRDLDRPRTADEWGKMESQLVEFMKTVDGAEAVDFSKVMSEIRDELPAQWRISPDAVASMTDDEAAVRWYVHLRISHDQHMAMVLSLPPRQAWPELRKLNANVKALQEMTKTKTQLEHVTYYYAAAWSLKRKIAALRIVEAVRHHLATHDGKFPASLDDITDIPIPIDPMTDEPFLWTVDGESAILTAPPLPADIFGKNSTQGLEYRLRIR